MSAISLDISKEYLEPPVRIELTTFRLQGGCSTTELGRRVAVANYDRSELFF